MKRKTRPCELYLERPMNFTSRTEVRCGICNDAIFCFTFIHFSSDGLLSLTLYLNVCSYLKVDWMSVEQFQFHSRQRKGLLSLPLLLGSPRNLSNLVFKECLGFFNHFCFWGCITVPFFNSWSHTSNHFGNSRNPFMEDQPIARPQF
jgi:hypothetical protein